MTLSMWLEPQHMGGMRYVFTRAKEQSNDIDYTLMRHLEGNVEFVVAQEGSDPVSILSNATTPLNEWTHVAVCLDGSEVEIYINGQLDASAGYAQRVPREGCRLWISSLGANTRFYNGKIDDVRIYNYPLSQVEIAALYTGKELGRTGNMILPGVIVVIALAAAGLAIYKIKAAA